MCHIFFSKIKVRFIDVDDKKSVVACLRRFTESHVLGRYILSRSPVQNMIKPIIPKHNEKWNLVRPHGK